MRIQKNLELRFGKPMRVKVTVEEINDPVQCREQQERIFTAFSNLVSDLLGRPASENELFGVESIEQNVKREKLNAGKDH